MNRYSQSSVDKVKDEFKLNMEKEFEKIIVNEVRNELKRYG